MGNWDYIVATPDQRWRTWLCHIKMTVVLTASLTMERVVIYCVLALSGADLLGTVSGESDDLNFPSPAVLQGHLQNLEILSWLDLYLNDLIGAQRNDVVILIKSNLPLFSDVPTRSHILKHDIDVGNSTSIKQHANRVNPDKSACLQQVDYMLKNGIAEPICSA